MTMKVLAFARMPWNDMRGVEVILDSYSEHEITCQRYLLERGTGSLSVNIKRVLSDEAREKVVRTTGGRTRTFLSSNEDRNSWAIRFLHATV